MRSVHQRFVISAGVVLALGFAFVLGLYVNEIARPSNHQIPLLNADSAASNERFAMASGRIDDRVEGIYTLDFLTGELQLAVLSTKTAKSGKCTPI